MNKYRNRETKTSEGTFDSQFEYERWQALKLMQRAGQISDLRRQVPYELIPAQREPSTVGKRGGIKQGKVIERKCMYIADFVYQMDGKTVVEDTKSPATITPDYVIKRKLMLYMHGIRIKEVQIENKGNTRRSRGHFKRYPKIKGK